MYNWPKPSAQSTSINSQKAIIVVKLPDKSVQLEFFSDMTVGDLKQALVKKGINIDAEKIHLYFGKTNLTDKPNFTQLEALGLRSTARFSVIYGSSKFLGGRV